MAKTWHKEYRAKLTVGQRAADRIASFGGSWTFILSFLGFLVVWIAVNVALLVYRWDPYPFILLNLVLSCLAAIQAPIILMSQNRQEDRDRHHAQRDFEVNEKAEQEIEDMQADFEEIKSLLHQVIESLPDGKRDR